MDKGALVVGSPNTLVKISFVADTSAVISDGDKGINKSLVGVRLKKVGNTFRTE